MDTNLQQSLALLWRRVLRTDSRRLFGQEAERLQDRNWGDRIAQPGFVGSNYQQRGLVFVSMNPGGGPNDGLGRYDLDQYEILKRLRRGSESDAVTHFAEINDLLQCYMIEGKIAGPIFQNFIEPVLQHAGTDLSTIAYLNLLKWRTKKSYGLNNLYEMSWRHHTFEQLQLLNPRVVIAIGTDAGKAFRRHYQNEIFFDAIPRVIGNNIGQPGRDAIRRIGRWLKLHPLTTRCK